MVGDLVKRIAHYLLLNRCYICSSSYACAHKSPVRRIFSLHSVQLVSNITHEDVSHEDLEFWYASVQLMTLCLLGVVSDAPGGWKR